MGRHRPTRLVATIWWRLDRTRITPACRRHRSRKPALAAEYGTTPAQLALAWLLHQSPQILLIPGTTSIGHLEDNMHAAEIKLDDRRMAAIADAVVQSKAARDIWQERRPFVQVGSIMDDGAKVD